MSVIVGGIAKGCERRGRFVGRGLGDWLGGRR